MDDSKQSSVDALLGDEGDQSAEALLDSTSGDSTAERSMNPEDTGENAPIQGKEEGAGKASAPKPQPDPRGVPWVDFVPEYTHERPPALDGRMSEHLANLGDYLADKEKLKLAFHNLKIHTAYQGLWVRESNRIFRALIRLKIRRTSYQNSSSPEKKKNTAKG